MTIQHQPVLVSEVIEHLAIQPEGIYIDGTFGRGGHSREILRRLDSKSRLFAFDKDPDAIAYALQDPLFSQDPRFQIAQASFTQLKNKMQENHLVGKVDGILLDLGVSSPQLDSAERGFSFLRDGPLDMRMNPQQGISAARWLETVSERELASILRDYGEERYAKRIAAAIIRERESQAITRTLQLANIIAKAHPRWEAHKHPATRSFQAIRIFINNELSELQSVLEQCLEVLRVGGRLLVITFHSLEDRIVKDFIQKYTAGQVPPEIPVPYAQLNIRLKKRGGAIRSSENEIAENPRARTACLRVVEKLT